MIFGKERNGGKDAATVNGWRQMISCVVLSLLPMG